MRASPQSALRTLLIAAGLLFLVAGVLWPILSRYPGRLPGDVVIRKPGFTLVFPIVTCLVISVILTLLLWIFRR